MEAELEAFRATAGPKGIPLEDAVSDFRSGGKGKLKAKEKQGEQEAGASGATSKGKARPTPRTVPALRARGSVAEADRSPVGRRSTPRGSREPARASPGRGSAGRPVLAGDLSPPRRAAGRLVDVDLMELRGDLRKEEAARSRKKPVGEKERIVLVAGHEERRSRSRLRGPVEAPRRKPREEELEEEWRIADAEREAELRDRERDLARRGRILVESLRKERRQREAVRSFPRASPSARRRRSPSGRGGVKESEGESKGRWSRGDPQSARGAAVREGARARAESDGARALSRPTTTSWTRPSAGVTAPVEGAEVAYLLAPRLGEGAGIARARRQFFAGPRLPQARALTSVSWFGPGSTRGAWLRVSSSVWRTGWDGTARRRCGTRTEAAPASARSYYLRVLLAKYTDMKQRNSCEMFTLSVLLDHLARGRTRRAADLAAQRLKAIERSMCDGQLGGGAVLGAPADGRRQHDGEGGGARHCSREGAPATPGGSWPGRAREGPWLGPPGGGRYQDRKGAPFGKGEKGDTKGDGKKGGKGGGDKKKGDAANSYQ